MVIYLLCLSANSSNNYSVDTEKMHSVSNVINLISEHPLAIWNFSKNLTFIDHYLVYCLMLQKSGSQMHISVIL